MLNKVTENLYIGNARLVHHIPSLKAEGISSILKLHGTPPEWASEIFRLIDKPVPDGESMSRSVLDSWLAFLQSEIAQGHRVLVMCGAGISRSSTAIWAYLTATGKPLPEAFQLLRSKHPSASPHLVLWQALIEYFDLPYSRSDIFQWRVETQENLFVENEDHN